MPSLSQALILVEEDIPDAVLSDVRAGGLVYQLPGNREEHYYLVVHRRSGFSHYERNLPGTGLLVWEIDEGRTSNSREESKRVDLSAPTVATPTPVFRWGCGPPRNSEVTTLAVPIPGMHVVRLSPDGVGLGLRKQSFHDQETKCLEVGYLLWS